MINKLIWWNGEIVNELNGEMVNSSQWGYDKISKWNGIIFLPLTNSFPSIWKSTNWVRGRFYSSIYASFYPFLSYSDLCYPPSSSTTSTFPPHLHLKTHPSLSVLNSPSFYPRSISLPLLHLHYFPLFTFSSHYIPLSLPLHHYLPPPLHLNLHSLPISLHYYLSLCLPLTCELPFPPPIHLYLHPLPHPLPLPINLFIPLPIP